MDKKENHNGFTINYKENVIEIYNDPRQVIRLKKSKNQKIFIELHSSLNGRIGFDVYPELLKKAIDYLE